MADTTFKYKARTKQGQTVNGSLVAPDKNAVAAKLREMGYAPVNVSPVATSGLNAEINIPGLSKSTRVRLTDLAVFSRQFATMINAGLPLLRCLNILSEQTESKKLAELVTLVRDEVEQGRALSDSLAKHEQFPKLYVSMVRAGETSGNLDEVMVRIAETLEKDAELRRKIKSAMAYPVVVLAMAALIVVIMLLTVVPTFVGMFESLNAELPLPTRMLISVSEVFQMLWFIILPSPIAMWFGFKALRKRDDVRLWLDKAKLKAPVFGRLFHKLAIARMTRHLGSLLKSGVPILGAIEMSADTSGNKVVSDALMSVRVAVKEGEPMGRPMSVHPVFPPMVVQMVSVGEEAGELDSMLEKIAEFYDSEVTAMTESLTAILEPVMIAVLASVVGVILVALYSPMFSIFDAIK